MGGGSEYAPDALRGLYELIRARIPAAVLSGIVGDAAHVYGYHRARNVLPASDYSVGESPRDRAGDGWAAAALDVSLPADLMRAVSSRLMAASRAHDPRLAAVREWFGTLDGSTVTGWDLLADAPTSSDKSHLWHVHLSIHRDAATDPAALAPIADVFVGATAQEDDMTPAQEAKLDQALKLLGLVIRGDKVDGPGGDTHPANLTTLLSLARATLNKVNGLAPGKPDVDALASALAAELGPDLGKELVSALADQLGKV